MEIYRKMSMSEFPENCLKCDVDDCTLPGVYKVRKACQKKRHKDCPLMTAEQVAKLVADEHGEKDSF